MFFIFFLNWSEQQITIHYHVWFLLRVALLRLWYCCVNVKPSTFLSRATQDSINGSGVQPTVRTRHLLKWRGCLNITACCFVDEACLTMHSSGLCPPVEKMQFRQNLTHCCYSSLKMQWTSICDLFLMLLLKWFFIFKLVTTFLLHSLLFLFVFGGNQTSTF